MQCEQAHEHLSAYLDGELPASLASAVRAHVASCPDCRRTLEELRATAALLGRLPVHAAPEGLADDVLREIEHRMLAPDPSADTPAPERTLAVHRPRRWPRVLAVAACAALATGIGLMAYMGTMLPDRPAATGPGSDALALRAGRHPGEAMKGAGETRHTIAGDRYDDRSKDYANSHYTYSLNGTSTSGLNELESLAKTGEAAEGTDLGTTRKAMGTDSEGLTLGDADALAYAEFTTEPAPVVGKGALRPEDAIAMKKAPETMAGEKPASMFDITGVPQAPAPSPSQVQTEEVQGKSAMQIAKGTPFGRIATDLERAGQAGAGTADQASQIVQEDQAETLDETHLAGTLGLEGGAAAAKAAGYRTTGGRAGGGAGGAPPANAPEVIQMAMNSVALGQAPVDTLRRTATPETLQQSPNQLVVRAESRAAANSELVRLFTQNGWAEVGEPAADRLEKDRKRAIEPAAEDQAEPQAVAQAAAPLAPKDPKATQAPARPADTDADGPPTTPGVYYRAHSDGEDTWVVVASADDLPHFAAQVAQSRTMIVGADSTQPFQAVRGLQQQLATFEAKANRRGLRGPATARAEKAEANAAGRQRRIETTPEMYGAARVPPAVPPPAPETPAPADEPTRRAFAPPATPAKDADEVPDAFAAGVEVTPAEEPPAEAEKRDRAPAEPAAPPATAPAGPDTAVQDGTRQRSDEEDDKAAWAMRSQVAGQPDAGHREAPASDAGTQAPVQAPAKPGASAQQQQQREAARRVGGLLANIQTVQRLPENQIMLIVRVQGPAEAPPAACIQPAERTEAETRPAQTKPAPSETAPPDASEQQVPPPSHD